MKPVFKKSKTKKDVTKSWIPFCPICNCKLKGQNMPSNPWICKCGSWVGADSKDWDGVYKVIKQLDL